MIREVITQLDKEEEDDVTKKDRESQSSETDNRKEAHELFQETLGNLQDAEAILKKACSELPNCAGFNSAGWLKSSIADPAEWYAWDDGDLYVKVYDKALLQEEPEAGPEFSEGQGEDGNKAIEMIEFSLKDTQESAATAMDDEKTNQAQFETNMEALTASEQGLIESIAEYELDLANTEKSLEQAHEDLATTEKEHKAIVEYLAQIEPGCTFIQTNYETRKQNRETEKKALEGAIDTLEASPAFQNFQAADESENLGECSEKCNGKKDTNTAECQACQEGVTIFGYCAQNADTPGCDEATKTESAEAMNAEK